MFVASMALLTVAALPTMTVAAPAEHSFTGSGTALDAWVVQFKSDVPDGDATRLISASGALQIGQIDEIGEHVISVPSSRQSQVLAQLQRNPNVLSVEQDSSVQAAVVPTDPHWTQAWGPRIVHAPTAWNMTTGTSKTIIAVVDTGVDPNQPDLKGRVLKGWDFVNNDAKANDDNGHGTAVAGVAAAGADDGVGIAGICWHCEILPVKVLNKAGSGRNSNIAAGIVWATDHGADVINMSLAGPYPSNAVANAVAYARNHGVVVVAAAGNEGSRRRFYPAAYPGVISVGATNGSDHLYPWSNRGSWVKVSAPGCAYTGSTGPIRWTWWCGTSFATPVVAGIAALIKSERPGMSRSSIENVLLHSTVNVQGGVIDGRIDAARAVKTADAPPPPPPSPTPTPTPKASATPTPQPTATLTDRPTASPTSTPTSHTYTWRDHLEDGDQNASRAFQLSGGVDATLKWSTGATLGMRIENASGDTVAWVSGSAGELDWSGSVKAGTYTVFIGTWSTDYTAFTLTLDN